MWRVKCRHTGISSQFSKLGRNHPMVKTQFFSEEIDGVGGLFPEARRAMMVGTHVKRVCPEAGKVYTVLVDVAGDEEGASEGIGEISNAKRDATALTIVEVNLESMRDDLVKAPRYLTVFRKLWVGTRHTRLYGEILALAQMWDAKRLVVD